MAFFIEYSKTKKSKYRCHPPLHSPLFCRHYLKLLSPTLQKFMNWILLSPPPLSSDPDNPSKFGTCTNWLCFYLSERHVLAEAAGCKSYFALTLIWQNRHFQVWREMIMKYSSLNHSEFIPAFQLQFGIYKTLSMGKEKCHFNEWFSG